ncbi:hypothetical protein EB796_011603 [Bugula neritina]|uniref:Uncharacterized protein n=1 Tax=Bugula neritina TaxID=10212 RepID=A0A7J7JUP1_BUGNE|nr:hypothetical protein EB796_011603 [Bugula neritina]
MFQSCLRLLSAMLADNVEIGGEAHIERLYLFCLMWTFGGLLDKADRKGFSDLLKSLSTALPDDDRDICVFDYYVDESGEWDPWQSRVPEVGYSDSLNMLGDVFVDTVETIRTRILMEFASQSGQNILLIGPYGSGKTSMINDFISTQDAMTAIHKRLVFSGASTSKQLQQFIELNVFHRQGFVYGAKEGKKFRLFVDDINLPKPDGDGVQRVNERHFAVFSLAAPEGEGLKNVVHCVLEAHMTQNDSPGLIIDLHNAIVQASCRLLQLCRRHCGLVTCRAESTTPSHCGTSTTVLWSADLNWFDATLDKLVKDTWQVESETLTQTFLTFNTDARSHQRVGIVDRQKFNKVVLQPMADMKLVYNCLNTLLIRHNEELGNVKLDIMLSDHIIHYIIKLHRILTLHHSGSMLLIGSVGCHLTTLCRLALYLADIDIFKLDTSKTNGFLDGLRSAIRVTGAEVNNILRAIEQYTLLQVDGPE